MNQITSVIVFYVITSGIFILMLILVKLDSDEKARKKCMMNHPAGSHVKTEPLHAGKTPLTLAPYGLLGPVSNGKPFHLEGDF
jgi:hypothetical protein